MSCSRWIYNRDIKDLVLGICFFCRLLLYVVWSKLNLVGAREVISHQFHGAVAGLADCQAWLGSCGGFVVRTGEIVEILLIQSLGTSNVFNMEELTNILERKMYCGTGSGVSLGRVHIDNACINVGPVVGEDHYEVLTQKSECYGCPPQLTWPLVGQEPVAVNATSSFQVGTRYSTYLEVVLNGNVSCTNTFHFEQLGLYQLDLANCKIDQQEKPVNAFLPIFWAFVALCGLAGIRLTYQSIYKTAAFRRFLVWLSLRSEAQLDLGIGGPFADSSALLENAEVAAKKSRRVKSLDAFRGLSITIMIFVNYGGGSYYFFNHSPWNGLTVADLVFPWFIWIMGVSLAISIQAQLRNSVPRRKIVINVVRRSLTLIILGLILNTDGGKNDLSKLRIPGVLQRFGVSYLVVGSVEAILLPREYPATGAVLLDLTSAGWQWMMTGGAIALHTGLTFQLPVPDCPTGYLGPGGLADNASHPNCTGGAAGWIDKSLFGENHIYGHPTCTPIYQTTQPYDPEGLLGTLNSIVLVWLGVVAGRILLVYPSPGARLRRLVPWSCLLALLAAFLCGFSKNSGVIPINKNLWSLSFILATGSMAFCLFSAMYLLIDVFKFWSGSPLLYPGMNSILLYIGHEMVGGMIPWSWKPFTSSHAELLAMNMWGAGLWVFTSFVLYRRKFFLAL